jgi:hypothetical protein
MTGGDKLFEQHRNVGFAFRGAHSYFPSLDLLVIWLLISSAFMF